MDKNFRLKREGIILEPNDNIGAIFNPGACYHEDRIFLFPRIIKKGYYREGGEFKNYISEIWLAKEKDAKKFNLEKCFLKPDTPYDKKGCEDARITKFYEYYFVTYTALNEKEYRIGLAITKDFSEVEKKGVIGPDIKNKDAVIFPEKIKGKIGVLHRIEPDIQIMYYDDIEALFENKINMSWNDYLNNLENYVVLKRKEEWESKKLGASSLIKTTEGWLLIYHAVDEKNVYRVGASLLDLDNPQKVIARSKNPILEPEEDYEKEGDVNNVVFPTGIVTLNNDLFMFYGAADKRCCLATCSLEELINSLERL